MAGTPEQRTEKRKITMRFSSTSLVTFFVLLIAAMVTAYILGVMAGRERPEKAAAQPVAEEKGRLPEPQPDAILQAHELEFTQALRGESPKPAPPKPEPEPVVQSEPVSPPAEQPKSAAPEQDGINDYIFQVAALKDEQAVDNLRQKLEGMGLRTRMERSGKVYAVMVFFRGDSTRVTELNEIASRLRLGAPLLRSKKPVSQP